jgi:hypothetical protein
MTTRQRPRRYTRRQRADMRASRIAGAACGACGAGILAFALYCAQLGTATGDPVKFAIAVVGIGALGVAGMIGGAVGLAWRP